MLITVIWLGAHLLTTDSQWARVISRLDSDIGDYQRFPMRIVFNSRLTSNVLNPSAEILRHYATAFETRTYSRKKVTSTVDEFLRQTNTVAFLVIKHDILLYEGYFNGYNHNSTVTSFSIAKSFVSALVGIAISDGYISNVEDSIVTYLPELL